MNTRLPPMLWRYFPKCPFEGPVEPVVHYDELAPKKCIGCRFFFEGGCRRDMWVANEGDADESWGQEKVLDFGPCGVSDVDGLARTPRIEEAREVLADPRFWIPAKCATCRYYSGDYKAECNRFMETLGLPCSLDFGPMSEERARTLVADQTEFSAGEGREYPVPLKRTLQEFVTPHSPLSTLHYTPTNLLNSSPRCSKFTN